LLCGSALYSALSPKTTVVTGLTVYKTEDTEKEFYSQQHREQALKREGSIDVKTAAVKFHTHHRSISSNF
jgi:hypothetical protein